MTQTAKRVKPKGAAKRFIDGSGGDGGLASGHMRTHSSRGRARLPLLADETVGGAGADLRQLS
jgi:hypothetical protein